MMSSPRTSTAPTGTSPAAPAATASASADRMKTLSRPPSGAIMRLVGARLGGQEKQRRIDEGRVQRHAEVQMGTRGTSRRADLADDVPGVHLRAALHADRAQVAVRSEERRVGKECRSRWSPYH